MRRLSMALLDNHYVGQTLYKVAERDEPLAVGRSTQTFHGLGEERERIS